MGAGIGGVIGDTVVNRFYQNASRALPFFGQDEGPTAPFAVPERPPTSSELELWQRAENLKRDVILKATICRLRHRQLMIASQFANAHGVPFPGEELPGLESRMLNALSEIERLRRMHCDVNGQKLGVRPSASGNDLDIVTPSETSGFGVIWIPIVIGVVILAGIIARWIYLESEVTTISEKYNGILNEADKRFCEDPSSPACQDWRKTKKSGDFAKNETLIDSVKSAVKKVGSGFGLAIALLIPVLALLYLPRKKSS